MAEYKLYDGEVMLSFNEAKHQYSVDNTVIPNVTSVTKIIDKSGPLMWWAAQQAVEHIRRYSDAMNGEIKVADDTWRQTLEDARKAHQTSTQHSAEIGHMAHELLATVAKDQLVCPPSGPPRLRHIYEEVFRWANDNRPIRVYPYKKKPSVEFKLYSREHGFAGTCDALLTVNGERCIVDWKTGKGIYPEMALQTMAYKLAYEEETGEKIDARWIVSFPEDAPYIAERYGPEHDAIHTQSFLAALELYKNLSCLDKTGLVKDKYL